MSRSATLRALEVLQNNGIIAHQTDTIFGLACLPKENLLQRLSLIKQRGNKQGFILLASDANQLKSYIDCTDEEFNELNLIQETPTTWLVHADKNVPPSLLGATQKIAVRLTSRPNIKRLCVSIGPLVSTSANISKIRVCEHPQQIRDMLGVAVDFIETDSSPGTGDASRIIDIHTQEVIRG